MGISIDIDEITAGDPVVNRIGNAGQRESKALRSVESFAKSAGCTPGFSCCGFRDRCNCHPGFRPFDLDTTNCFGTTAIKI